MPARFYKISETKTGQTHLFLLSHYNPSKYQVAIQHLLSGTRRTSKQVLDKKATKIFNFVS